MKTVIYNLQNSDIGPYEEDMAFKAAYLFATTIIATGDSSVIGQYKNSFIEDAPLKHQLMILETQPFSEPEWRELAATIPRFRKEMKRWNEIKHPTKAMLVSRKKLLDSIKANYLHLRNYVLNNYPGRAILVLDDLITKENFGCIEYNPARPELQDDIYTSLSNLMKASCEKEGLEQGLLFLLTDNFFGSKVAAGLQVAASMENAEAGKPFLVSLFRFSDLNDYKKEELQTLRQDLLSQIKPFTEAVNGWTETFAGEQHEGTEQLQRMEEVYTAGLALGRAITAHLLVEQGGTKEREVELVAGAVPATMVWHFFREVNALPDESWEILRVDATGEKLCPVLAFRYPDRANFYMAEGEGLHVTTQKKSIQID
ncbi:MAG: hypothetical protein EON98_01540 [Chitinophagaceae bacterium]|nr:MAG: hypothetical protein EON98_01540 [Chitinophagaceae bacterium]